MATNPIVPPSASPGRLPALPPRAVLFDMDGLLIDSEPLWDRVTHAFCARRGASYDAADAAACIGRGGAHTVQYLAEKHGWASDPERDLLEITGAFGEGVPRAAARPGAEALLRGLCGALPLALGSSTARPLVEAALSVRGFLALFDVVVTGSDVERLKPFPDIYLEAARRLAIDPVRCVVFEDSRTGCEAARAAGMFVVAVPAADPDSFVDVADRVDPDLLTAARAMALPGSW